MIRPFSPADLDRILDLWLETNLQAHSFIPPSYWRAHLEGVRRALPQAEAYLWEEGGEPLGFVGLDGDCIAGIFVRPGCQSAGIGKCLLDRAKGVRRRLTLHVYQKNPRAIAFYRREGFSLLGEGTDPATGEAELVLVWTRPDREEPLC